MSVPTHIGFILDGNRRWAQKRGLDPLKGHQKGYDSLKTIGRACLKRGIKYISAYVFSTENWNRTPREVKYLMDLLHKVFTVDLEEFHKDGFRVLVAGKRDRLSPRIKKDIQNAEEKTANNKKATLILAFNYGGRGEIVDAVKKIVQSGVSASRITEKLIQKNLYLHGVPDPDLIVRTSGEQRLSGFLTWESVYSELYFTEVLWPDFNEKHLDKAINEYNRRQRRFGK